MTGKVFVLGLTGSIGMGKSTTAGMFRNAGVPVWDADEAVHRLYGPGGAAGEAVAAICPDAVSAAGVDRAVLRDWIANDAGALHKLNAVVHPLVAQDRQEFIEDAAANGVPLIVVDVPLLFETGAESGVDAVLVVSAPAKVQKARVMARKGMTEEHYSRILAHQIPDDEKRQRADYVIESTSLDVARKGVEDVIRDLTDRIARNA